MKEYDLHIGTTIAKSSRRYTDNSYLACIERTLPLGTGGFDYESFL